MVQVNLSANFCGPGLFCYYRAHTKNNACNFRKFQSPKSAKVNHTSQHSSSSSLFVHIHNITHVTSATHVATNFVWASLMKLYKNRLLYTTFIAMKFLLIDSDQRCLGAANLTTQLPEINSIYLFCCMISRNIHVSLLLGNDRSPSVKTNMHANSFCPFQLQSA